MKFSKILFAAFILCIFSSFTASAQDDREDVVYLKNGNIYRGTIIEQVPGKTLKVETLGGNVFTVDINDITKITKEKKVAIDNGHQGPGPGGHPYDGGMQHSYGDHGAFHHGYHGYDRFDTTGGKHGSHDFHYRKKGYFFEAQLQGQLGKGGMRIINGYKFSQFGYLGIGVGADLIGFAPIGDYNFGGRNYPYAGTYLPLFLHYEGDILRKRITPFYSIDGGYALKYGGSGGFTNIGNLRNRQGGMMGGVGFGVKFNTKRRVNLALSANADFQTVNYIDGYNTSGSNGMTYRSGNKLTLMTPGLKFGIGF